MATKMFGCLFIKIITMYLKQYSYSIKILLFLIFSNSYFSNAQLQYCKIGGQFINKDFEDTIYIVKGDKPYLNLEDLEIVDSVATHNGIFLFKIPLSYTDYYSIKSKVLKKGFRFICSPGVDLKIKIDTSNFYKLDITGSLENTLYKNCISERDPLIVKMNSYVDSSSYASKRNDSEKVREYDSLNIFWAEKIKQYNLLFILKYPKCFTSLKMFNSYYELYSKDSVRQYLKNLPLVLKKNPLVKEIKYKKFILENELKKITKFYEVKYHDTLSKPFSFNPYYGKLVLIDFWASWCKPCIENFPTLKIIESKYRDKNFAIIGVSLDINLKRWKNEIKRSGLLWKNISDLKGTDGLGTKYLNVTSIPRYVLIGKNGVIINDDIQEKDLEKNILANLYL
jgi:thiol-disulfide isomerase/thioredoxin